MVRVHYEYCTANTRPHQWLSFLRSNIKVTDNANIATQAAVASPLTTEIECRNSGQEKKKGLAAFLAEGEGFEPPGLLTQLFSRQPQ